LLTFAGRAVTLEQEAPAPLEAVVAGGGIAPTLAVRALPVLCEHVVASPEKAAKERDVLFGTLRLRLGGILGHAPFWRLRERYRVRKLSRAWPGKRPQLALDVGDPRLESLADLPVPPKFALGLGQGANQFLPCIGERRLPVALEGKASWQR